MPSAQILVTRPHAAGSVACLQFVENEILERRCAAERRRELRIEAGLTFFRRSLPVQNDRRAEIR